MSSSHPEHVNVTEMVVSRRFGTMIRHRDFEDRSNPYDALLAVESWAMQGRRGIHPEKELPVMHITGLLMTLAKKTKDSPPFCSKPKGKQLLLIISLMGIVSRC